MEISGKTVRLRPLAVTDLSKMIVWNSDDEVQTFVDCNLPSTLTELERWFYENVPNRYYQIYAIETIEGKVIGDLELDHINWAKQEAEVRIRIGDKESWGMGYGTEALRLMLSYWFTEKKFKRIYLRVYQFNRRAIRCYLKNGFKQVGILQRRQENWKDIILMETDAGRFLKKVSPRIA